jgi:hypothetical protein
LNVEGLEGEMGGRTANGAIGPEGGAKANGTAGVPIVVDPFKPRRLEGEACFGWWSGHLQRER